jgi:DNA-binding NarL/FixJ family response regulator
MRKDMETIQLAVADARYASVLKELLSRSGSWKVVCADPPDPQRVGVLVIDLSALRRLRLPLPNPERVVVVAEHDSAELARAWNAGIRSVVSDKDPLDTVVLAIMAARLAKPHPQRTARREVTPPVPG